MNVIQSDLCQKLSSKTIKIDKLVFQIIKLLTNTRVWRNQNVQLSTAESGFWTTVEHLMSSTVSTELSTVYTRPMWVFSMPTFLSDVCLCYPSYKTSSTSGHVWAYSTLRECGGLWNYTSGFFNPFNHSFFLTFSTTFLFVTTFVLKETTNVTSLTPSSLQLSVRLVWNFLCWHILN